MYPYAKSTADICVASISLLILSGVWVLVAVMIKLDSKGPVLFRQQRYGKDKRPFTIYKFRTMTTEAPANCATNELTDASSYITRIGKIMRKLSIDELPQLLNVVKGEMSLIGPRPVILSEVDLIRERDMYAANTCKPGVTGWAQANGRDELDIFEKARMDGEYVNNLGLLMDLRCLYKTIDTLLFAKGYQEGGQDVIWSPPPAAAPVFYARIKTVPKKINRPVRRRSTHQ